jgi:hypothetical protein
VGGRPSNEHSQSVPIRIVPHARTIRKAREQVKAMVNSGFSALRIKAYLRQWALWWVGTVDVWQYEELLRWFIKSCWEPCASAAEVAAELLKKAIGLHTADSWSDCRVVA